MCAPLLLLNGVHSTFVQDSLGTPQPQRWPPTRRSCPAWENRHRRHRGSLTSFAPPNLYAALQDIAMALRFPDETIGYPPLLSGRLLCRIVDMDFRESTIYEVGCMRARRGKSGAHKGPVRKGYNRGVRQRAALR